MSTELQDIEVLVEVIESLLDTTNTGVVHAMNYIAICDENKESAAHKLYQKHREQTDALLDAVEAHTALVLRHACAGLQELIRNHIKQRNYVSEGVHVKCVSDAVKNRIHGLLRQGLVFNTDKEVTKGEVIFE